MIDLPCDVSCYVIWPCVQLVKFSEAFPDSAHAYIYGALTFVGGIVLGFALYSWAIWV